MTKGVDNSSVVKKLRTSPTGSQVEIGGSGCSVDLECLLDIVRALGMGSCLSAEGGGALPSAQAAPSGTGKRRRREELKRSDSKLESWLHRVPGRLFLNGFIDAACLYTKQGKKGVNQDTMIVWENFGSKPDTVFCGVFDGHGPHGHVVAKEVRDTLPQKLSALWELNSSNNDAVSVDAPLVPVSGEHGTSGHNHRTNTLAALKESFLKAFKVMDKELKFHPDVDCYCSGTTAVTMVKQGHDLYIGNIGDSRAVLGTRDMDGTLAAVQLTVDHKPNLPRERERIRRSKGRVFALSGDPDRVSRVWLPNNNAPGLAMARAFGDLCLKNYGVISVPEIYHHRLSEKDEFVILATDGVWDVLSNKEVVDIVASLPRPVAARCLVELAAQAWKYRHPKSKVDDCAVVCLFLDPSSSSHYTSYTTTKEPIATLPDQVHADKKNSVSG